MVEIANPLLIMKQSYINAQLKDKFSKASFEVIERNGVPLKVIITFNKELDASSFITQFNGKSMEKSIK